MGWHPRPPAEALPLAGPLWFYARWFRAPLKAVPISVFWFNHTVIETRQGPLTLVVPLRHEAGATLGHPSGTQWAEQWLKSLRAAYGKMPYFEQLYAELEAILREGAAQTILTLGQKLHGLVVHWLMAEDLPQPYCLWLSKKEAEKPDFEREASQRFRALIPINPGLSIWHALMNHGRYVREYLLESLQASHSAFPV